MNPKLARTFRQRAIHAIGSPVDEFTRQAVEWLSKAESKEHIESNVRKLRADVVIINVIDVERRAILNVLGGREAKHGMFPVGTREVFHVPISSAERDGAVHPLDVYVVMVGEPRNVPCANLCRDILEVMDVGCFILLGIAGGDMASGVEQGDVIAVNSVFYVEGGKRRSAPRLGRDKYVRSRAFEKPKSVANLIFEMSMKLFGAVLFIEPEVIVVNIQQPSLNFINEFQFNREAGERAFTEAISHYEDNDFPPGERELRPQFEFHHPAHILCGEKVVVDGSVGEARNQFNRKILGIDMESYGFAATCNYLRQPWFIFRGISDYANPKKNDAKHVSAAVAAAVTTKMFLIDKYKTPEELGSEDINF
jgi:nucleoside phosphorylase